MPGLGVWEYNVARSLVRCNHVTADLFKLDRTRAAHGMPLSAYLITVHPKDAERVDHRISETVRNLGTYSETYQVLDADGQERLIFAQGAAYETPDGVMFPGSLISLTAPQLATIRQSESALDAIAEHCLAAQRLADARNMKVVKSLLDMTLEEVGRKLAIALRTRLHEW